MEENLSASQQVQWMAGEEGRDEGMKWGLMPVDDSKEWVMISLADATAWMHLILFSTAEWLCGSSAITAGEDVEVDEEANACFRLLLLLFSPVVVVVDGGGASDMGVKLRLLWIT